MKENIQGDDYTSANSLIHHNRNSHEWYEPVREPFGFGR